MSNADDKKKSTIDRVLTVIGIILCVILAPILIINCTMIIKSYTNKDEVPSFFSISPMIVLTDSMYPNIKSGDLIIVTKVDAAELKKDDVISFFDPAAKKGNSVVTHRIQEITVNADQTLSFVTKGDNNNTADELPVPASNLVGRYVFRIAGAGSVAMFMQTTPGLLICVALPVILLVGYDLIRRRKYDQAKQDDTAALLKELEELRAQKAQGEPKPEDKVE